MGGVRHVRRRISGPVTAARTIPVRLIRSNARQIARWLETQTVPVGLGLMPRRIPEQPTDMAGLIRQFDKVATRKHRIAKTSVVIRLARADAEWFARQRRWPGMIFSWAQPLPEPVDWLSLVCWSALYQGRGRPRLSGDRLTKAINRGASDERHRTRLRSRKRKEDELLKQWPFFKT